MKKVIARLSMVCVSLTIICLMFTTIISNAQIDPQTCVGAWLFDEGKGEITKDLSGNGNDAEIVGAKWVEGKRGQGLEFDGTNHVRIPASATTDDYLNGFTYLLWAKPLAIPPGPHTRLIERNWHNPNILIGPTDFYGSILFKGAIDNSQIRGGSWLIGEWSFVVLTHDGTTLCLYVDGEMVNDLKVEEPDFSNEHDGGSIWLAQWKGGAGWDFTGVIDEVGVFNVALSLDDIKGIMKNGLSPAAVSPADKLTTTWASIKKQ